MTYNVFGGTLNPTTLPTYIIISHTELTLQMLQLSCL